MQWLAFSEYWDWWGPGQCDILPSSILMPLFALQLIAAFLGLATLLKANTVKAIVPALLSALALYGLYFQGALVLQSTLSVAFWLSVLSTAAIMTAMAWIRIQPLYVPVTKRERTGENTRSKPNRARVSGGEDYEA